MAERLTASALVPDPGRVLLARPFRRRSRRDELRPAGIRDIQARLFALELDRLIAHQDFDIHFQPIVDVAGGRILGFEALTRTPAKSALTSPLMLFQVAADLGRLVELERLVVRHIVQRFVELDLPGQVFINVSADTLAAARYRNTVIVSELARAGLPAGRIVVELTETRAVTDATALAKVVKSLRAIGISFALDDLGEGFASLKRWIDLRPDFVKIDRHFVDGIATDPVRQQFVRSILDMARSSGTAVIAEGLEQVEDLRTLRQLGATLCQGYLLARPLLVPSPELTCDLEAMRTF